MKSLALARIQEMILLGERPSSPQLCRRSFISLPRICSQEGRSDGHLWRNEQAAAIGVTLQASIIVPSSCLKVFNWSYLSDPHSCVHLHRHHSPRFLDVSMVLERKRRREKEDVCPANRVDSRWQVQSSPDRENPSDWCSQCTGDCTDKVREEDSFGLEDKFTVYRL